MILATFLWRGAALTLASVVIACSGGDPPPQPPPGPDPSKAEQATPDDQAPPVGPPSGQVGGKSFVPGSASAHAHLGYVHGEVGVPAISLVFSSAPDVCSSIKGDRYLRGETYVVFHNIRAEVGTDTVGDAEAIVVAPGCPPGTDLQRAPDGALSSSGRVVDSGATVKITRLDAQRVEGTVSARFDDGSTLEGGFSLPLCAGSEAVGNDPICD